MQNRYFIRIFIAAISVALIVGAVISFRTDTHNQTIETLPTPTDTDEITIVAFGDSLTAGYGLPVFETYPAQLENALRADGFSVRVINAGVSGETTRGNLERATFVHSQSPNIVLLGIGGNDALRQLPIDDIRTNITKTIDILTQGENPPVVLLLRMQAPLNAGSAYKQSFDAVYPAIAKEYGLSLIPFITPEVFLQRENLLPDGIHLNAMGNKVIVETYLVPALKPLLAELRRD